jgi:2-octaprenyl-6-methoxyphenol hydroxylase
MTPVRETAEKGTTFDVAIAGASFAGLALARALRGALGAHVSIALVDRPAAPGGPPDPRAYAVSAASRHLLHALGVWPALAEHAEPVTAIEITDTSLEAAVRPPVLIYDNRVDGEPATHIVPASALKAALAADLDGITHVRGAAVSLAADETGVTLALAEGEPVRARLVVAADGRRSRLREAAGIKIVGWTYPQVGIVTTVAHAKSHGGHAVQHFLPGGPFAILPLKGDASAITWTEHAETAQRIMAGDDAAFLAEVERRFGLRLGELTLAGPRATFPLEMHLARSYVADRLVLVGDAAHGVHPIAGQGVNLAFRDVAALGEVLVDAARLGLDWGDAGALERYQRWRRFDTMAMGLATNTLNFLFSNESNLLRTVRDIGLGLVDRAPPLKNLFIRQAAGLTGEVPKLLKGEAL